MSPALSPNQAQVNFATWQPIYAEHGIPTFPVRFVDGDKKPAVASYLKMGLPAS